MTVLAAPPVISGDRPPLLRVATAGSVDDGKSTLIGRLLHDSKSVFEDQLAAVVDASSRRGTPYTDLALLTDGLRAEREQGITIDVAYRYFATPARSFVLADTPGHVQYTRNMVTGASTADVAVVLVDSRRGLTEQSRRHAFLAALLRVPHIVLAVNKIDLVDFDEGVFGRIVDEFSAFTNKLGFTDVAAVPVSALLGDNVVTSSDRTPWYAGPSLLSLLESLDAAPGHVHTDGRVPVQYVIRDHARDFRGYAGQVAGGTLRKGDDVVVLPSGVHTTVASVETYDGELSEAVAPLSVVVRLADDVDVSRGDLIASATNGARVTQDVDAVVCWMTDDPLRAGAKYALKHTTRWARAVVRSLDALVDVTTLETRIAAELRLNDIGRVTLRTTVPLVLDDYDDNRTTGSFVLVDEATGATVGAGMVGPAAGGVL